MITATGLTMHYGPVVALNDVSFDVGQGEIVGLLGPNGAGKSTTMKILTTYLHPTKGSAKLAGMDVIENPLGVRRKIGYLPESLPLYMDMEVREYLAFVGRARGLSGNTLKTRTNVVLDACGLRPMYRKVIRELSKGYKQRTALAQSLIHDPDIIILDEPTSGLDPHQILEVRHLIRDLAHGKTVLLSTHILQEVEASCDRIIIIDRGRIAGIGTYEELRDKAKKGERYAVTLDGAPEDAERVLSSISGVNRVEPAGDGSFLIHGKSGSPLGREISEIVRARGWALTALTPKPLSLEETFLSFTSGESDSPARKEGDAA